ncbi:hypothetical protein [Lactiplantibacillus plantarum]|uniref:hypothetical protein n=1 Tax=Lactiplantibacillus plantarum TaxID=1590 RepID=UPI002000817D|nr:hypothetical protein [Lactiplantibacillus plantarum]
MIENMKIKDYQKLAVNVGEKLESNVRVTDELLKNIKELRTWSEYFTYGTSTDRAGGPHPNTLEDAGKTIKKIAARRFFGKYIESYAAEIHMALESIMKVA